ncbi:hypothetical protein MP228_001380 [Amoeboaphelidium protococcarum]|nr:hypothetical protein MP228_001380 [Amoeboaphelidium protococcarum]
MDRKLTEVQSVLSSSDYYDILGLDKGATNDEIRKAYLKKSRWIHPDKNQNSGAKDAFLKLNKAYDILKNPRSRRHYDLYGQQESSSSNQSGFGGIDDTWKACISEVFHEFMNQNYEPVMAVLDVLHRQNPGLSIDKDSVHKLLGATRDLVAMGKIKWELIQPELKELSAMKSVKELSLFDVIGRLKFSLRSTRIMLIILKKGVFDDMDGDFGDHIRDYLESIIVLVEGATSKLDRTSTWFSSWF